GRRAWLRRPLPARQDLRPGEPSSSGHGRAHPVGFHRRFEVLPGAQAQVDWGDEGEIQTQHGPLQAFSFHMTLAYSLLMSGSSKGDPEGDEGSGGSRAW